MDGYRAGLVGPELDYAVKKYKGHRMIPREHLAIVQAEFKQKQEDKLKKSFKVCWLMIVFNILTKRMSDALAPNLYTYPM